MASLMDATATLASLQALPTAGHGLVRLDLLRAFGDPGARERFEQLVTAIVTTKHPAARAVEANPGDWGIDTFVGRLSTRGTIGVWQSKYFMDGVGDTQKKEIRESFKSICAAASKNNLTVSSWTLAIPVNMDPDATKWWDRWKAKTERDTKITIDCWQASHIEQLLIKDDFADVRHQYFGFAPGEPMIERAVADPDDWTTYDGALFIKQLQVAAIAEDQPARRAFFNAEVMTRDVQEREVAAEVNALNAVSGTLHQMWHSRFESNNASAPPGDRLPALYPEVMQSVEAHHGANPSKELKDTLVHRCGLVHHLVETGHAGWVRSYAAVAEAHPNADIVATPVAALHEDALAIDEQNNGVVDA